MDVTVEGIIMYILIFFLCESECECEMSSMIYKVTWRVSELNN